MSESNGEPGLISDEELPEDLQPDENSPTDGQSMEEADPGPDREPDESDQEE